MHTTKPSLFQPSAFRLSGFCTFLRLVASFFIIHFTLFICEGAASAAPSQSDILAIAADSIKTSEPKFANDPAAQNAIRDFRFQLQTKQKLPSLLDEHIGQQTSSLTLLLATGKQRDLLLLLTSEMLLLRPDNVRLLNLQGAILHTKDDYERAATVYERAVSLQPDSITLQVNLANVYLDFNRDLNAPIYSPDKIDPKKPNRDADAKKILDKLETEIAQDKSNPIPLNKDVCLALSTYWHKQNFKSKAQEYWEKTMKIKLAKGKKTKKIEEEKKIIEKNIPAPAESLEQMEPKLRELAKSIPLTAADIIMEDFPEAARKIKLHYTSLDPKERLRLPKMPNFNIDDPEQWRRNSHLMEAWIHSIDAQLNSIFNNSWGLSTFGDNLTKQQKKEHDKQAKKAANEEVEKGFNMANNVISLLAGMDIPDDKLKRELDGKSLDQTRDKLFSLANKMGVAIKPVKPGENPLLHDAMNSLFGYVNMETYDRIVGAYERYYDKWFNDFQNKYFDILERWEKRLDQEDTYHNNQKEDHDKSNRCRGNNCIDCRKLELDHKKRVNEIHKSHYKQWTNLCVPQYERSIKPIIQEFHDLSVLYIKNMPNKEFAQTKYRFLAQKLKIYGSYVNACWAGGGCFRYEGLEKEEQELLEEIDKRNADALEAAKQRAEKDAPPPDEFNYTDWFEKNVSVSVSAGLFSVKISAQSIEFDVSVIAANAGIKYDFEKEKVSTTVGVGLTGKIGVSVGGVGVEVKTKVDVIRQTSTWDLANGKYEETYSTGAKLSGKIGDATLSVSGELNSQLVSKVSASVSRGDISYNLGKSSFDWSK